MAHHSEDSAGEAVTRLFVIGLSNKFATGFHVLGCSVGVLPGQPTGPTSGLTMSDTYGSGSRDERTNVKATIKWFNMSKGFGFAQVSEGEPDVFVHASVVTKAGIHELPNGATIECDVTKSERGYQVSRIHHVDLSTAEPVSHGHGDDQRHRFDRDEGEEREVTGTVKFFDANKGFGFVTPEDGGRDVFVPARVLPKTGIVRLEPNQRVHLRCRDGDRGPLATWVELA